MANMASVAYAIEGSEESLEGIQRAILEGLNDKKHWTEYTACKSLGFTDKELDNYRLGGEIDEDATNNGHGVLKFYAEERWGLQDFYILLKKRFPDITVYWLVEESGCAVYCTNDKEGKYFPERYWVDTAIDDIYQSEYFKTKEAVYKWLDKLTYGRVKSEKDVEKFNADYEDSEADEENFIYIHEFEVED